MVLAAIRIQKNPGGGGEEKRGETGDKTEFFSLLATQS